MIHVFLAAVLALGGSFAKLAMLSAVARLTTYLFTCAGLPILRKKVTGNLPISRIIIAILGAAFSLLIVITLNRYNFLAAAIALALGALIYFLSARRLLNQTA